jgi:uncharacterized membrane protein YeiH
MNKPKLFRIILCMLSSIGMGVAVFLILTSEKFSLPLPIIIVYLAALINGVFGGVLAWRLTSYNQEHHIKG